MSLILKENWKRFKKIIIEPTLRDKNNKYYHNKTVYMRKLQSKLFLIAILAIGCFMPSIYFVPSVMVITITWLIGRYYDTKFDKGFINPLNETHRALLKRYNKMAVDNADNNLEASQEVINLTNTALKHYENWPVDKTSRWIGYAQGMLIQNKFTTVDKERDFSRPLFHRSYNELGYDKPRSVSIYQEN